MLPNRNPAEINQKVRVKKGRGKLVEHGIKLLFVSLCLSRSNPRVICKVNIL